MAEATPNQLFEMWRRQVEESTQAWTRLLSQRAPTMAPPDPTAFWRPVLDQGLETWAKLFAQPPAPPELLPQWKQFIDQWIEAWSKVLGQAMGTEQFAKLMGQSLDQFLATHGPLRRAAEQQTEQALQALQLPSRSQVTAVAKMRSEEHTSELQSPCNLVCRLLLEKKKKKESANRIKHPCRNRY